MKNLIVFLFAIVLYSCNDEEVKPSNIVGKDFYLSAQGSTEAECSNFDAVIKYGTTAKMENTKHCNSGVEKITVPATTGDTLYVSVTSNKPMKVVIGEPLLTYQIIDGEVLKIAL